jgi:hypothetical protein
MMPHWTSDEAVPPAEFSTKRALIKWKHFKTTLGSQEHEVVANYLIKELNKLGLRLQFSKGILSDWGNLKKYSGTNKRN